ncbi:MAG: hypothetical protein QF464_14190 [Myxococcota bacterium]|jgi:hypothetical protein|nr:hypothetical protein [Myxococcota bacterium]
MFPSGTLTPTVTVTTVLMFAVHLYAAWDAAADGRVAPEAAEAEAPAARGDA